MNRRLILPATPHGKLIFGLFMAVIFAGLWPAVLLANRTMLVLGLPALATWSCLIIVASTAVMLTANRLLPLPQSITMEGQPPPQIDEAETADDE